jgi:uncharacterized protein with NAD-binding domain and iron-sulfur cluster
MRVAIVGSGISGLTANYLLATQGNEVVIFEHEDTLGMDSKSVDIPGNYRLGNHGISSSLNLICGIASTVN